MIYKNCSLFKKSLVAIALVGSQFNTTTHAAEINGKNKSIIIRDLQINNIKDYEDFICSDGTKGKIPTFDFCEKALKGCAIFEGITNPRSAEHKHSYNVRGGTSAVNFTSSDSKGVKYVIKRAVDKNASSPENEIEILGKLHNTILQQKIKGFKTCLPIALFNIKSKDKLQNCNIQIQPFASDFDMGHVVRSCFNYRDEKSGEIIKETGRNIEENLQIIESFGKTLAEFQNQNFSIKDHHCIGHQHGDFSAGNVCVTIPLIGGDCSFTLIDLGNYRNDGRLICDPVCFIYFASMILHEGKFIEFHDNTMPKIINSFFSGYIKNLDERIRKNLKDNVFKLNQANPLEMGPLASALASNYKPGIRCENMTFNQIKELENWQVNAFNRACLDIDNSKLKSYVDSHKHKNITELNYSGKDIDALAPITALTKLRELYLSKTKVVWVGCLKALTNLEVLDLSGNPQINDKLSEVMELTNLKKLTSLDLRGTNISKSTVDEIQKKLTDKCKIKSEYYP